MAKTGPIIIVEDDLDDRMIFQQALQEMGLTNGLITFTKTRDAFDYLKTTREQPFIIFSDINLPAQNGLDFKRDIDADPQLRQKSIPFVFYSTNTDKSSIDVAYKTMSIQGFFQKESSFEEIKQTIRRILEYWQICKHPNS